jgi:hypothetical protein
VAAVFFAPWAVVPVIAVYLPLAQAAMGLPPQGWLMDVVTLSLFGVPIAYAAVILLGVPTHLALTKIFRSTHWYAYATAAVAYATVFQACTAGVKLVGAFVLYWGLYVACAIAVALVARAIVLQRQLENQDDWQSGHRQD